MQQASTPTTPTTTPTAGKSVPRRRTTTTIRELARQVHAEMGYRGFWRGLVPTLYRDVPFSALYWLGFEQGRKALMTYLEQHSHHRSHNERRIIASFLAGALSGSFAALVTTPFDVVKTRRQMVVDRASLGL